MGVITETAAWVDQVYLLEETDLVKGGEEGPSNIQAKELANRTAWLKKAIRGYVDITLVSATKLLTKDEVTQKLVVITGASAYFECTLPDLANEDLGTVATITATNITAQVGIVAAAIQVGPSDKTKLYISATDRLELVWIGNKWILLDFNANLLSVGDLDYGYAVKTNTVVANGQLKNRADLPRLWEYVQTLGSSTINDSVWLNTPNMKGFFSHGNGTTTFRVPDLRSMFIRGLDLGAGITNGRNNENPGGYEADEFKKHKHSTYLPTTDPIGSQYEGDHMDGGNDRGLWTGNPASTNEVGGTETRPKNIGLLPLIKV